jgi:toxin ParE1/3/4
VTSFRLTPLAVRDLKAIARYSARTWGVAQSRAYRAKLGACMEAIAAGRAHVRAADERGLSRSRCARHIIVFRRGQSFVEIVAIFHPSMDFERQLAGR